MATKIELVGQNVKTTKGTTIWYFPMSEMSFTLSNSILSLFHKGDFVVSDASNDIQDIDGSTLASDAAVVNYLGQFVGVSSLSKVSNATTSQVAANVAVQTLLAANEHRTKAIIHYTGADKMYVKLGATATAVDFTYYRYGASTLSSEKDEIVIEGYTGIITAIWDVATGNANVTEIHI